MYKIIQELDVLKELEVNEQRRKKIVTEKVIVKALWCIFLCIIIAMVYLIGRREDLFLPIIEFMLENSISRDSADKYILLFFVALAGVLIASNMAEVFTKNFKLATKEEMIRKGAKYSKKYLHFVNELVENEVLEYVAEMPDPAIVWAIYKKPSGVVKRIGFEMQVIMSEELEKEDVIINFDARTVTYSYYNKELGNEHAKGYKGNIPVDPVKDICTMDYDVSQEADTVETIIMTEDPNDRNIQ